MKGHLLGVVALLFLALSGPLWADTWYEHYLRADDALEEGRWQEAVEELNHALALRGDSVPRARIYGMKVISYFPYYKLGIAYYHLGRFDAALQAFDTEESLGAISQSPEDFSELQDSREIAAESKRQEEAEANERILEIVRSSLAESERLEGRGSLEAAIEALSPGLAASGDHPDMQRALTRLQGKVADRQREREVEERVRRLSAEGRAFLGGQDFEEAASRFKQALTLRPDPQVESLLREAESGLRQTLRRVRALAEVEGEIEEGLRGARESIAGDDRGGALAKLQRVLALDADHAEALELQTRLIREQAEEESSSAEARWIEQRMRDAAEALSAGAWSRAVALANEVLAVDGAQAGAQEAVRSAYFQINRSLLQATRIENLPPAISFFDLRAEDQEGSFFEAVGEPEYVLSGLVFDETPVVLTFFREEGESLVFTAREEQRGDLQLTHFRLELKLAAGSNELRVVAMDPGQLSSSSTYDVRYEPPFYRHPAFSLIMVVMVLGPGFALYWRRLARRRKLQRRRYNPYVAGAPVFDESRFFGRRDVLDRVLEAVASNSIMLFGERRIGKTSIQHQLRRRLLAIEDEDYEFYPVFIDLQGIGQDRFFATIADEIFRELGPVLGELADKEPLELSGYTYRNLVRDLRDVLRALRAQSAKRIRLVLQIDEIDQLNSYDPQVNQLLRSLFMKSFAEDLVAIVSGVQIKKHWELEGSPWYNFFEEIEVLPLRRGGARRLVEEPIRGVMDLDPDLFDAVYELCEGKPYSLQKVCKRLVNRAYEDGRSHISVADLEAIDPPSLS